MKENIIRITVAGTAGAGKNMVALLIEKTLREAGLTDVNVVDLLDDIHMTRPLFDETLPLLAGRDVEITITTEQLRRIG